MVVIKMEQNVQKTSFIGTVRGESASFRSASSAKSIIDNGILFDDSDEKDDADEGDDAGTGY